MAGSNNMSAYFAALMERTPATKGGLRHLRLLALAHIAEFRQIWIAARDAIRTTNNIGSTGNSSSASSSSSEVHGGRELLPWFFVDALLHDAPVVYASYVARELPLLCRNHLPLNAAWAAPMLRSWVPLLPAGLTEVPRLAKEAAAAYARAQLERQAAEDEEEALRDGTARSEELASVEDLRELEATLHRCAEAVRRKRHAARMTRVKLESVKKEEPGLGAASAEDRLRLRETAAALQHLGGTKDTAMDADEDYAPTYVAGARPGRLRTESDDIAVFAPPAVPAPTTTNAANAMVVVDTVDSSPQLAAAGTKREKRVRPRQ